MSAVPTALRPVREFFVQRDAERTVRAYSPGQYARVRFYFDAGENRSRLGRRFAQGVASAILLREAVVFYLSSAACARDADADVRALELAAVLPPLPPDVARADAEPTDDQRVRAVLASKDVLYFDRRPPEDLERDRNALDRACAMLRDRVEVRSLVNVKSTRWGRLAALAVVGVYALFALVRWALAPTNIARGKPVSYSSLGGGLRDGQQLVDGTIGTTFAIHTLIEEQPHIVIDLRDNYRVTSVNVHNRPDGWQDDCLSLLVEVSTDGKTYSEIGRREQHFDADPPWMIDGHMEPARYVRLRLPRRGYIALSEVEVYGKNIR